MTLSEVNQIRIDALTDKPTAPEDVLALCEALLACADRLDPEASDEIADLQFWIAAE
jgi:hypothetical protein